MNLGRRPKTYAEMVDDPEFPYRIGALMGSASLAAHLLVQHGGDSWGATDAALIGEGLARTVSWFYLPGKKGEPDPVTVVKAPQNVRAPQSQK